MVLRTIPHTYVYKLAQDGRILHEIMGLVGGKSGAVGRGDVKQVKLRAEGGKEIGRVEGETIFN